GGGQGRLEVEAGQRGQVVVGLVGAGVPGGRGVVGLAIALVLVLDDVVVDLLELLDLVDVVLTVLTGEQLVAVGEVVGEVVGELVVVGEGERGGGVRHRGLVDRRGGRRGGDRLGPGAVLAPQGGEAGGRAEPVLAAVGPGRLGRGGGRGRL